LVADADDLGAGAGKLLADARELPGSRPDLAGSFGELPQDDRRLGADRNDLIQGARDLLAVFAALDANAEPVRVVGGRVAHARLTIFLFYMVRRRKCHARRVS
jgi:hypothetical protein